MSKNFEIRNSTAEFLIFQIDSKDDGIQVVYKDETIWATQKAMSELFEIGVPAVLFSRVITGPLAVIIAYVASFGMFK